MSAASVSVLPPSGPAIVVSWTGCHYQVRAYLTPVYIKPGLPQGSQYKQSAQPWLGQSPVNVTSRGRAQLMFVSFLMFTRTMPDRGSELRRYIDMPRTRFCTHHFTASAHVWLLQHSHNISGRSRG
jgi:hypothetical protein